MGTPPSSFIPPRTPELSAGLAALADLIKAHERFVVVSHVNPDGDAVGATLSMALVLEALGKHVIRYNRDPVPYNMGFLPGAEAWTQEWPEGEWGVIMLDCGERHRIGEEIPDGALEHGLGIVDHHKTWDPSLTSAVLRDVDAAAAGELVYALAMHLEVGLTQQLATCLYCCLMTDTGSFRYSSTSRTTFQIAGELIGAGVDPWYMTSHLYESQPARRVALLREVLSTLRYSPCGRLACLRLERGMLERTGATLEMADGFINYGRSVSGVEVATQLRELEDGSWRVSFRSRGAVDVSSLAVCFGGEGRHNAASCQMSGTPEEVEASLCDALTRLLGSV